MARVVMSLAEWQAVSRELTALHNATAPPGLLERIEKLLAQAPQGWPDQPFALELDDSCIEAVQEAHAALLNQDPGAGQRIASVAEAVQIIHEHQQRS